MGKITEFLSTLHMAVGVKRYAIGGAVTVALAIVQYAELRWEGSPLSSVPTWVFWIIVVLFLLFIWVLQYAHRLRQNVKGISFELAALRTAGVKLRNDGRHELTREELIAWEAAILKWDAEVIAAARKVDEGRAEFLSVLDTVPRPRISTKATDAVHQVLYQQHDYRLKRLAETIDRLWGKQDQ